MCPANIGQLVHAIDGLPLTRSSIVDPRMLTS
jgi:hypothetical protein